MNAICACAVDRPRKAHFVDATPWRTHHNQKIAAQFGGRPPPQVRRFALPSSLPGKDRHTASAAYIAEYQSLPGKDRHAALKLRQSLPSQAADMKPHADSWRTTPTTLRQTDTRNPLRYSILRATVRCRDGCRGHSPQGVPTTVRDTRQRQKLPSDTRQPSRPRRRGYGE